MKKIVCLIPFYGSWPNFTSLFIESCRRNEQVDFLFLTDLDDLPNVPNNVHFFNISFKELLERIANKTGITVGNIKPYKLCDFRPAYGVIFDDLLTKYDFWGYCDMDLIFGNLLSFLTPEVLDTKDIICFRKDHLHGPFTLFRNREDIVHLYTTSDRYQDIFKSEQYLSFDEFGTSHFHLNPEKELVDFPDDSISILALKAAHAGNLSLALLGGSKEIICDDNTIVKMENGIVSNYKTGESYSFYHWVIEKRAIWFKYPNWETIPERYFVTKTGFYSTTQFKFYVLIHSWRLTIGLFRWTYLKFSNYIKRRFNKKVNIDTYPRFGFIKYN